MFFSLKLERVGRDVRCEAESLVKRFLCGGLKQHEGGSQTLRRGCQWVVVMPQLIHSFSIHVSWEQRSSGAGERITDCGWMMPLTNRDCMCALRYTLWHHLALCVRNSNFRYQIQCFGLNVVIKWQFTTWSDEEKRHAKVFQFILFVVVFWCADCIYNSLFVFLVEHPLEVDVRAFVFF